MTFEAWSDMRQTERHDEPGTLCHWCGGPCSGDTTERIEVDGASGEVPICDDPDTCPANIDNDVSPAWKETTMDNNVQLVLNHGQPHFFYHAPTKWYECFNFGASPSDGKAATKPGWVVLGWVDHSEGDSECVEAFDTFGEDAAAALTKLAEIVAATEAKS